MCIKCSLLISSTYIFPVLILPPNIKETRIPWNKFVPPMVQEVSPISKPTLNDLKRLGEREEWFFNFTEWIPCDPMLSHPELQRISGTFEEDSSISLKYAGRLPLSHEARESKIHKVPTYVWASQHHFSCVDWLDGTMVTVLSANKWHVGDSWGHGMAHFSTQVPTYQHLEGVIWNDLVLFINF